MVAGDANGRTAETMLRTSRNVSRIRGHDPQYRRGTRLSALGVPEGPVAPHRVSACSTASNPIAEQGFEFSQQPCKSPMMSNGPCSSRLSFQSGFVRWHGLDFLGRVEDEDVGEALPFQTSN